MQKLGIYSQTTTTASTSSFTVSFEIAPAETGFASQGNVYVVGVTTGYSSYASYWNYISFFQPDNGQSSESICNLYENGNISGTTVSVSLSPSASGSPSELLITVTPGSSTSTKWSVYYKDFYYEI